MTATSTFKHDSGGFLVGELIDVNRELLAGQTAGMAVWRVIHSDVKAIARALGVQARNTRAPQPGASPGRPRAGNGRFVRQVVTPAGCSGNGAARGAGASGTQRTGASAAETIGRSNRATTVTSIGRSNRGRLPGAGGAAPDDIEGSAALGRFTGGRGSSASDKGETDTTGRLAGAIDKLGISLDGTDGLDPTITALKEVKDAVSPLGRGMFSLLGRGGEQRKETWYKRILKALTGKKESAGRSGGPIGHEEGGSGGFLSTLFSGGLSAAFLPVIAAIGTAIVAMAPVVGAALAVAVAAAVAAWLVQKALETPAGKKAKADFDKGSNEEAGRVKYAPPVHDADGHLVNPALANVPVAVEELPPATSMSQRAGRFVGWAKRIFKNGTDVQSDADASDPVDRSKMTKKQRAAADLKQRSLETGAQYSAGNIGGLSDAQTRALVASTAMTESGGGKLDVVNSAGYMGRYQAGAGWLADAGLIKGGAKGVNAAMAKDGSTSESAWAERGGMTKFLKNDDNWTGGLSYQKYLNSADTQDKAFKTNSDAAYKSLMADPTITDKSPESMAGLLKAQHLAGLGGARVVGRSDATGPVDANGTSTRKYYDDVAKDKNGFLSAYTGGTTVSAGAARIPPVVIPSSVPERIAPIPDAAIPAQLNTNKPVPVNVSMREPIGQDVGDRNIAHVVSGGLGMMA